ncbi:hypothetical protein H0484_01395 [Pusillimonas sp. CC-YST705]|uniref:Uncharacterized protein n=1 Tax=Mesopusillimonas faecipullorum TaxID=2755040 RepID=A0ABS8C9V8_9BURK|nr:hypothetical protein [Mesopusillimonas faecipullorum]MCB5362409.1 hypothetical protein [Mesopusillimonas faecipullorum]
MRPDSRTFELYETASSLFIRKQAGEAVAVDSVTGQQARVPSAPDVVGNWRTGIAIGQWRLHAEGT